MQRISSTPSRPGSSGLPPTPAAAPRRAAAPLQPMHSRRDWAAVLTLAVVSLVTFSPAISCQFVNLDDSTYVVQNKSVKAGLSAGGVAWAFTTFDSANWHPLTWLSLQLDATLWRRPDGEPAPAGFHLTNVLLHAANAGLLFLALRGLTGCYWRSVAVALFFAVHPLRVESVAWVAERKDVLSAFFGLLALWAYAGYVRGLSTRRYLAVVIPFVLSLLAKPMLVTLPCLLLVLDWWPLARARSTSAWVRLAIEKLPLFVLAALSSVVTVQAQAEGGAIRTLECFTPVVRAENAVVSYAVYLGKTAWPVGLSVFYPHPVYGYDGPVGPSSTEVAGGLALLVAISVAAIIFRKRAPYLLAGWLWYVGTLVPVIGLVQVGGQAYADRYTYIPQIGVLLALCWGAADLARAWPRTLISATAVAAAVLAVLSVGQLRVWQNSYSLWEHAYHVVGRCPNVYVNLGECLEEKARDERDPRAAADLNKRAFDFYQAALRMDRESWQIHYDLGNALEKQEKWTDAEKQYREICRLDPKSPGGYTHLGNNLLHQQKHKEAREQFQLAYKLARDTGKLTADLALVPFNLAFAEYELGEFPAAVEHYRETLRLKPDYARAQVGLGIALVRSGRAEEGIALLQTVVRKEPGFVEARYRMGEALESLQNLDGAATEFQAVLTLKPNLADAWRQLGYIRLKQGQGDDAVDALFKAVTLNGALMRSVRQTLTAANRADLADRIEERLPKSPPRSAIP
jgi:tetratricopeptide (TPR) repeat protein